MLVELSERNKKILKTVVKSYLVTAEPVGSRTLSKKHNIGLSPATIRNVMADLEDMGYLTHPHTSAGRLPTDKGYRYYVDSLMDNIVLTPELENEIKKGCLSKGAEMDELMKATSIILSKISHQAGIVVLPNLTQIVLKHIYFVKLSSKQLLAVFVSKTGLVQNKVIKADENLSQDKLDKISKYLNEEFRGLTLKVIRERMLKEISLERAKYDRLFKHALRLAKKAFKKQKTSGTDIYIGGTSNIVNQPEFKDNVENIRLIVEALEDKDKLIKILDRCIDEEDISVIIGSENHLQELQHCSLITKGYYNHEGTIGLLGIVGHKRMEYPKVVAIVDYTANLLSTILIEK